METETTAEQALARLYADYAPSIVRHLERLTHNRESAEGLAQETFIKALRSWGQLASGENVRAWLFRIATNTAYDEFRRRRRRATTPLTKCMRRPARRSGRPRGSTRPSRSWPRSHASRHITASRCYSRATPATRCCGALP